MTGRMLGPIAMAAAVVAGLGGCGSDPERAELWIGGDVQLGAGTDRLMVEGLTGSVGVINLEGPVGPGAADSTAERLVNAPEALPVLVAAGVRVAGIANNHAADLGPAGAQATLHAVNRVGLLAAGNSAGPAALEIGGLRVVVTAHDLGAGVPRDLAGQLASARGRGDVLIATFHVTGPPSYVPRPELRHAVAIAIAAGARVIAAHGTHVVGPVERRGEVVIAWGLGNLAFDCPCGRETEGAILRVSVGRRGAVAAEIVPIAAGIGGAPARPAADPSLALDLLEAIGSSHLVRRGDRAGL